MGAGKSIDQKKPAGHRFLKLTNSKNTNSNNQTQISYNISETL